MGYPHQLQQRRCVRSEGRHRSATGRALTVAFGLLFLASAQAQQTLPNAPAPQPDPTFYNVRYASEMLPPQTLGNKFAIATHDSFGPFAPLLPAVYAGVLLAANNTPEFGHGGVGYSRYLWHTALDQAVENYTVEFIVPAIAHEDTRYYVLGQGTALHRTGYALSRAVLTRSDSGATVFNIHEVIGSGAAAGISTLYYPTRQRSLSNTAQQWGFFFGIDSATFVFKEFWPDLHHALFHTANRPETRVRP